MKVKKNQNLKCKIFAVTKELHWKSKHLKPKISYFFLDQITSFFFKYKTELLAVILLTYGTNQRGCEKSWIHVIILKLSEIWCSLKSFCVEITLLSQVTNVGWSPKKLFIPVDPPLDEPGISNPGWGYSRNIEF